MERTLKLMEAAAKALVAVREESDFESVGLLVSKSGEIHVGLVREVYDEDKDRFIFTAATGIGTSVVQAHQDALYKVVYEGEEYNGEHQRLRRMEVAE